jgi:hypothetical protein
LRREKPEVFLGFGHRQVWTNPAMLFDRAQQIILVSKLLNTGVVILARAIA